MNSKAIKLDSISRFDGGASGYAAGRNGWRFEFTIGDGKVCLDTRGQDGYDAKADARQIRRELKKIFPDLIQERK